MKPICILLALCAFGCSQAERPTPLVASAVQSSVSVTLSNLVHVDAVSSDTQHPLVCESGRDFPSGREFIFRNPQSREFVHAVFPEVVTPPNVFDGKFVLHGQFRSIQNKKIYTLKQPPEDYRYFVVSYWEENR